MMNLRYARSFLSSMFVLTSLMTMTTAATESFNPSSLQSGPDLAGSSFASSIAYDRASHSIVVTGSTFGHFFSGSNTPIEIPGASTDCFLATIRLSEARKNSNDNMKWEVRKILGDEGVVPESCSTMIYHERHSKLIVAGQSERNGFMDSLYNDALIQQATEYGFLLDIDVASEKWTDPLHLVGGRVLQTSKVNYPLAIASRSSDTWIYVASQETDSLQKVEQDVDGVGNTFRVSAEVDPMRLLNYVGNYRLVLSRYQLQITPLAADHLQHTLVSGWSQIYAIRDAPVHVAGIAEVGNVLLVAGTTNGTSPIFGGNDPVLGAGSLDGFISKFNKDTGHPLKEHARASHRIQSLDQSHDWVAGICHSEQDEEHIYVVGATEGKLNSFVIGENSENRNVEAFVLKVHVETLEEVWTRQIGAHSNTNDITRTRGVSCVVDGEALWIAGIVEDGAVLRDAGTTASFGNDDVFVAKLKSEDGNLDFVRQLGSTEDDSLAMRGALAVDKDGNCVLVGNTYGEFYRKRPSEEIEDQPWISDVFITIISATNGAMAMPASHPEFRENTSAGGKDRTSVTLIPPKPENIKLDETDTIEKSPAFVVGRAEKVVLGSMALALLVVVLFINSKPTINRDVSTRRSEIIRYLHDFDVNDIDLKHSATGGWHCSYGNDLANGVNHRAPRGPSSLSRRLGAHGDDPLLTAPLNDKVVRDSLFMDDDGHDGLRRDGLGNSFELSDADASTNQGYDGLVEAYNSSWEERKGSRFWGKDIV